MSFLSRESFQCSSKVAGMRCAGMSPPLPDGREGCHVHVCRSCPTQACFQQSAVWELELHLKNPLNGPTRHAKTRRAKARRVLPLEITSQPHLPKGRVGTGTCKGVCGQRQAREGSKRCVCGAAASEVPKSVFFKAGQASQAAGATNVRKIKMEMERERQREDILQRDPSRDIFRTF